MATKQYVSPTGSPITGTLERVPGIASIAGINDDGTPEYDGNGTKVLWDDQESQTRDGKILYVDDDGREWTFDQLKVSEENEEEDA